MSNLHSSRHPCVHCQGNAFRAEFEEVNGLGRVKYLRCLNCGNAYPEYTAEQDAIMERWEAETEEAHRRACEEFEQEMYDYYHPEAKCPFAVRVNGTRLGIFETQEEASAYLKAWAERWAKPGARLEVWKEPDWGAHECLESEVKA